MAAVPHFFATSTVAFTFAEKAVYSTPPWWVAPPVDGIGGALSAAGANALNVTDATKDAARALLLLLVNKPEPEITIESSGEISFEWYKDNHHVAVLTVDGQNIRWAAMLDQQTPISGWQPFGNFIPPDAMTAIDAAI